MPLLKEFTNYEIVIKRKVLQRVQRNLEILFMLQKGLSSWLVRPRSKIWKHMWTSFTLQGAIKDIESDKPVCDEKSYDKQQLEENQGFSPLLNIDDRVCEGAYKGLPSNRVISNKEEVISNKQKEINNKEEEVVSTKENSTSDIKSVIKVFENNIHPVTPIEHEIIAFDEVKRLYAALEKLDPFEKNVVERFYLREDTLKEISCEGDLSYYDYVRIKNKALDKLKKYI